MCARVPPLLLAEVVQEADRRMMTLNDWICEAMRSHLAQSRKVDDRARAV